MHYEARQHRLFFALWPDPATRAALARLQVAGNIMPADKLHLTLAFLGQRAEAALPELCRILERVPARAMTLELDTLAYFSGQRIAWAGMQTVPAPLLDLRAALMRELAAAQCAPQFEQDRFRPHITLARKASACAPQTIPAIVWPAAELVLAESPTPGGHYRLVASRRLT